MVVAQDVMKLILEYVDRATAPMKKTTNSLKQLGRVGTTVKDPVKDVASQMRGLERWSKKLDVPIRDLSSGLAAQNLVWKKSGRLYDVAAAKTVKIGAAMGKAKKIAKAFKFEWLGVMFAGMALTRVFKTIFRATYETFTKAGGLLTKQGQAVLALSAHWELLKYSIFNALITALEPLIPAITKIIWWMADWVTRWPRLTAAIVLGGFVIGTLALVVGQLMLAFNAIKALGLVSFFSKLGTTLLAHPVIMAILVVAAITLGVYLRALGKIAEEQPGIWEKITTAWKLVELGGEDLLSIIQDVINGLKDGDAITLTWAKAVGMLTVAILALGAAGLKTMEIFARLAIAKALLFAGEPRAAWEVIKKIPKNFEEILPPIKEGMDLMSDILNMSEEVAKEGTKNLKDMEDPAKKVKDAIGEQSEEAKAVANEIAGLDTALTELPGKIDFTKGVEEAMPGIDSYLAKLSSLKSEGFDEVEVGTRKWNESTLALMDILGQFEQKVYDVEDAIGTKKSLTKTFMDAVPVIGEVKDAFALFGTTLKEKVEAVILTVETAMYGIIDATQTFILLSTSTITALNAEAVAFDNATAAVNRYADAKRRAAGRGAR